jgi:hypothetical protein
MAELDLTLVLRRWEKCLSNPPRNGEDESRDNVISRLFGKAADEIDNLRNELLEEPR